MTAQATTSQPLPRSTSPAAPRPAATWEFYSWYFMRLSGLLLVILALGHFALMHLVHSILEVDYDFAARRWAIPAWRLYDWLLLTLALLHGCNGLRVVVDEYLRPGAWRTVVQAIVGLLAASFLLLGTYVVIAFKDPA